MNQIKTLNERNWKEKTVDAWGRCAAVSGAVVASSATSLLNVFATDDGGEISSSISTGLQNAWSVLKAIGVPVAIIALAICAFQFFLNGDKGMEVAKKRILYIVMGIALLLLAPWLIQTIVGWFNTKSGWYSYGSGTTATETTAAIASYIAHI